MKFNSKTPIGGSDFLRRGFGRQAKNKVVILFHTTRPIPFFAAAIATATPAATPLFSGTAPQKSIAPPVAISNWRHGGAHMTSVWTSGRFEPGCAVSATAALHLPSQSRLRWIIGEGSQHHATVCRKSVRQSKISI